MTPDKSLSPMTVQQLLDREQLRDVAMRYCRGVDRLDADCMKSAYWPEAIDEHGSFIGNAHDFSDYCMTAHLRWKWTMHSIYNHQIDFDDDGVHASGELYNITNLGRADSGDIDTWYGRYLDRYEKRGNEWRIMHRVCVHNGTQTVTGTPMAMDASKYRDGSFDRPADGRRLGP